MAFFLVDTNITFKIWMCTSKYIEIYTQIIISKSYVPRDWLKLNVREKVKYN